MTVARRQYAAGILAPATTLEATSCAECGIAFGLPAEFLRERRRDGRGFFCPNGHDLSFHETDLDRARKELAAARRRAELEAARATAAVDQAAAAERSARALRGVVTRTKNRVAAGACPAGCHRHFTNLQRHMTTKHPGYTTAPDEERTTP